MEIEGVTCVAQVYISKHDELCEQPKSRYISGLDHGTVVGWNARG